jgi:membrane protein implicated in regulation of membrane protease activity
MKATKEFVITLSSILLAFFLVELGCFVYFADRIEFYIYYMIIAQLIVFSIAACSVIVFSIRALHHRSRGSSQGITRIVLLSEANEPKEEYSLINRTSALIGKRDTVYFRSEIDLAVDGYAVINCVDSYWYVERVFEEKSVGLKRAGEQFVYKLRTGINYQLQINDIIYIANERLLVL